MKIFRLFVAFTLICFALSPAAHAVVPAPDGGYPGANTAEGLDALLNLNVNLGIHNTGIGRQALLSNIDGDDNTAVGYLALRNTTGGSSNTATGSQALSSNTTGDTNTADGAFALFSNTTASGNTATGAQALLHNTTGTQNTATGFQALQANISAPANTATGAQALFHNTTGTQNTATGFQALHANISGLGNTATGSGALFKNTGHTNTATGSQALFNNTSGVFNTAIGAGALQLNTTGSYNIAVGNTAGGFLTTGDNNIEIGTPGVAGDSATIRIGSLQTKTYIAGIDYFDASDGLPVYIQNGQLGLGQVCHPECYPSSERFKDNIKPMDKVSEAILALKPVTFRYKKEFKKFDRKGIPQFGLVAEDVQKVNPDLIVRDPQGKPYGVRYDAVNAMLLNEFLKEHRKVEQMQKQIDALTAGLQKVSAQLELSKAAPQTVSNDH
jgi:hypothetical protein